MKRFLITGTVILGIVIAALAATQYGFLYLTLPDTEGAREVPGLRAETRILRDVRGVPTILAGNDADAYAALGYVHAQDRLWQMDMMRRLALGRLSEILGEVTLKTDKSMRFHGFGDLARAQFASLDPDTREALRAYALGVNAFLRDGGPKGAEFAVLGYDPEPWEPWHSLLWQRLMALRLGGNWRGELVRLRLAATLPADRIEDLWAARPGPVTASAPGHAASGSGASNAWVVSGARSETGAPLLAGDPHLGLRLPTTFHLARLQTPHTTLAGAFAPGVPFLVIGHNGHVAWTFTTTHADTSDLFVESDANLIERREAITVDGAEDVALTVRRGRHGAVVSDLLPDEDRRDLLPDGRVLTLATTFRDPNDTTPAALLALNRAADVAAALRALESFQSPVQNVMLADTAGRIGFAVAGRVPVRAAGRDGWTATEGDSPDSAWTGFIPPSDLPRTVDPESGYLVNANNAVTGDGYPYFISRDYAPPFRAERIVELLTARDARSAADFQRIQMDHLSRLVPAVLPVLLDNAARTVDPAAPALLESLAAWDGRMDPNRPEPLIFFAWLRETGQRLWGDELGDDAKRLRGFLPLSVIRMLTERPVWCDDAATPDTLEDCRSVVGAALDAALADLRRRFGDDPTAWRWGDAHRVELGHPLLGRLPVLGALFTDHVETAGGETTVSRGTMIPGGDNAFAHVHGSVLRIVFDLADLDRSGFVMPGGQSSHLLSDHYDDLTAPWANGELFPIVADPDGEALVLTPATAR